MAKKESLETFAKNFSKFDDIVETEIIRMWNEETAEVLRKSQEKAPVRVGDLQGSGRFIRAKETPTGIESFVEFKVPYASVINDGERNGKPISLKPVGHSYFKSGKQAKRQKGEVGFLSKAVDEGDSEFVRITSLAVENGFNKI